MNALKLPDELYRTAWKAQKVIFDLLHEGGFDTKGRSFVIINAISDAMLAAYNAALAAARAQDAPSQPLLPKGFRSLDDYMAELMADPQRAKEIEEARPVVLRAMLRELCNRLNAVPSQRIAREPTEALFTREEIERHVELWYDGKLSGSAFAAVAAPIIGQFLDAAPTAQPETELAQTVRIPLEPTDEMLAAGHRKSGIHTKSAISSIWCAMYAAAIATPAAGHGGEEA